MHFTEVEDFYGNARGLYFPADVYIFPPPPASDVYIFPNFAQRYRADREIFLGKNNAFRENLG